jgi:hypothetical protein
VIIPEEAEAVIPLLRRAKKSQVHMIMYAAPVTRKMLHFDTLTYYALPGLPSGWKCPSWLSFELGVLAGRLYFNYSDYDILLEYLNVVEKGESDSQGSSSDAQANAKNILAFLTEWLATRRQGQDITHTPMGYVCQGRKLRSDHPFFMHRSTGQIEIPQGFTSKYQNAAEDEHEDELSDVEEEAEGSVNDLLERDQDEDALAEREDNHLGFDEVEGSAGDSLEEEESEGGEDDTNEGSAEEYSEVEDGYSGTGDENWDSLLEDFGEYEDATDGEDISIDGHILEHIDYRVKFD